MGFESRSNVFLFLPFFFCLLACLPEERLSSLTVQAWGSAWDLQFSGVMDVLDLGELSSLP